MLTNGASTHTVAMLAHTCYLRDPRVRREAEALAEKGLDVHVICLSEEPSGENGQREAPATTSSTEFRYTGGSPSAEEGGVPKIRL